MLKKSIQQFLDDDCLSSGAAMAFYTIFSLPPLLVIVLMITSALGFTKEEVDRVIHDEMGFPATEPDDHVSPGRGEGRTLHARSGNAPPKQPAGAPPADPLQIGDLGILSKFAGIAVLLFSATAIFGQLQFTLNRVWEVEPDPRQGGIRSFLLKRLFTAGMVITMGFILLVSLVLTTMIDQFLQWIMGSFPGLSEQFFALLLNELAAFAVCVLLFASMFKLLPDAKLCWRDVWLGAAATALLFVIGKAVIGWYLRTSQVGSSWGASAASSVAALVWVYYSSLIVLYGAELTNVWATRNGCRHAPEEGAVRTVSEKRHIRSTE